MASKNDQGMLTTTAGTWCFWSPEMCCAETKVFSGYSADLWAAGVCLYVFSTGSVPFFSLNPTELFQMIEKAEVKYKNLGLSNELQNLLGKILSKDPSTRPGVRECLTHNFCANAISQRMEELSEERIVTAQDGVGAAKSEAVRRHSEPPRRNKLNSNRSSIQRQRSIEMMDHMEQFQF